MDSEEGREMLRAYYLEYILLAQRFRRGLILDTPTWRSNPDWGRRLGYDLARLRTVNLASVKLLADLRSKYELALPIVISGALGPKGDGYQQATITADEAEDYHSHQVGCFAESQADLIAGYTLTSIHEAIGITRAAVTHSIPCAISFTVEADGLLADGTSLGEAISAVDDSTNAAPIYYLINCAHPAHFATAFEPDAAWTFRLRGLKANASSKTHDEIDGSNVLDAGDPKDLAARYRDLRQAMPSINILGGCCGTDCDHIAAICEACP